MHAFDYATPESVADAVVMLSDQGKNACVLAGGTDLIVQLRENRRRTDLVVDVKRIAELNALSYDAATGVTIGAAVPCYRIYGDAEIAAAYPGLMDAARLVGGTGIQGRASLGGNLCNASPAGDTIPPMIVLSGEAEIAGPNGTRKVAVEDFCTAPGRTVLEDGEFLVSLHFPAPAPNSGAFYRRFIPRNEMDIAVVGVGASVVLSEDRSSFVSARIAVGAVAPTPLFVREAGDALAGQPVSDESIQRAADLARDAARPISDMRGTAEYRKHLTSVLTRRVVEGAVQRAKE
ncbi:MAG: xanthine dehydrogenase family protein subunit M [Gemmatimonadetes bacterium]|nr:xanthine dehydrogenase family protein subunit M [Gemmatimonadota bacterium]MYB61038.1 xanthine dehydrogenase family protein subunit M [Gemmatimonadota bacterium]